VLLEKIGATGCKKKKKSPIENPVQIQTSTLVLEKGVAKKKGQFAAVQRIAQARAQPLSQSSLKLLLTRREIEMET
jgi:hypothetical protein